MSKVCEVRASARAASSRQAGSASPRACRYRCRWRTAGGLYSHSLGSAAYFLADTYAALFSYRFGYHEDDAWGSSTALVRAARTGNTSAIHLLLLFGEDVNGRVRTDKDRAVIAVADQGNVAAAEAVLGRVPLRLPQHPPRLIEQLQLARASDESWGTHFAWRCGGHSPADAGSTSLAASVDAAGQAVDAYDEAAARAASERAKRAVLMAHAEELVGLPYDLQISAAGGPLSPELEAAVAKLEAERAASDAADGTPAAAPGADMDDEDVPRAGNEGAQARRAATTSRWSRIKEAMGTPEFKAWARGLETGLYWAPVDTSVDPAPNEPEGFFGLEELGLGCLGVGASVEARRAWAESHGLLAHELPPCDVRPLLADGTSSPHRVLALDSPAAGSPAEPGPLAVQGFAAGTAHALAGSAAARLAGHLPAPASAARQGRSAAWRDGPQLPTSSSAVPWDAWYFSHPVVLHLGGHIAETARLWLETHPQQAAAYQAMLSGQDTAARPAARPRHVGSVDDGLTLATNGPLSVPIDLLNSLADPGVRAALRVRSWRPRSVSQLHPSCAPSLDLGSAGAAAIGARVRLNAPGAAGLPALYLAVQRGATEMVALLLSHHDPSLLHEPERPPPPFPPRDVRQAALWVDKLASQTASRRAGGPALPGSAIGLPGPAGAAGSAVSAPRVVTSLVAERRDRLQLDISVAEGDTPLCLAAARGDARMVQLLLHFGASINMQGKKEHSPLLESVLAGQEHVVRLLLRTQCTRDAAQAVEKKVVRIRVARLKAVAARSRARATAMHDEEDLSGDEGSPRAAGAAPADMSESQLMALPEAAATLDDRMIWPLSSKRDMSIGGCFSTKRMVPALPVDNECLVSIASEEQARLAEVAAAASAARRTRYAGIAAMIAGKSSGDPRRAEELGSDDEHGAVSDDVDDDEQSDGGPEAAPGTALLRPDDGLDIQLGEPAHQPHQHQHQHQQQRHQQRAGGAHAVARRRPLHLRRQAVLAQVINSLMANSGMCTRVGAPVGDAGMEVDLPDESGYTPLFIAAERGYLDSVAMLMSAGADHTRATKRGKTVLYAAVERGHLGVIKSILPYCKIHQLRQKTKYGTDVIFQANKMGKKNVKDFLNAWVAEQDAKEARRVEKAAAAKRYNSSNHGKEQAALMENLYQGRALHQFDDAPKRSEEPGSDQASKKKRSQSQARPRPTKRTESSEPSAFERLTRAASAPRGRGALPPDEPRKSKSKSKGKKAKKRGKQASRSVASDAGSDAGAAAAAAAAAPAPAPKRSGPPAWQRLHQESVAKQSGAPVRATKPVTSGHTTPRGESKTAEDSAPLPTVGRPPLPQAASSESLLRGPSSARSRPESTSSIRAAARAEVAAAESAAGRALQALRASPGRAAASSEVPLRRVSTSPLVSPHRAAATEQPSEAEVGFKPGAGAGAAAAATGQRLSSSAQASRNPDDVRAARAAHFLRRFQSEAAGKEDSRPVAPTAPAPLAAPAPAPAPAASSSAKLAPISPGSLRTPPRTEASGNVVVSPLHVSGKQDEPSAGSPERAPAQNWRALRALGARPSPQKPGAPGTASASAQAAPSITQPSGLEYSSASVLGEADKLIAAAKARLQSQTSAHVQRLHAGRARPVGVGSPGERGGAPSADGSPIFAQGAGGVMGVPLSALAQLDSSPHDDGIKQISITTKRPVVQSRPDPNASQYRQGAKSTLALAAAAYGAPPRKPAKRASKEPPRGHGGMAGMGML